MNYMTEANAIAAGLRSGAPRVAVRQVRGPSAAPSPQNREVLAFMREFFAQNDQLPPLKFISVRFGWTSVEAATWHVAALVRHGLIERNACGKMRFARERGGVQ